MRGDANSRARSLKEVGASLVERLRARQPEIEAAIFARVRAVSRLVETEDAEYEDGLCAAVAAVVNYCFEGIEQGPGWLGPTPSAAAAQARRAARAGVSLGTVLRRYVAGHGELGEFVMEEAQHCGLSNNGDARYHIRRTQEALLEHLTAAIEREYNRERKRIDRSPEQHREEIVHKLLDGESPDDNERAALGYELDAWHLCVIVTGEDVEKAIRRLAVQLGRELLPVARSKQTVGAWLGGQRALMIADVERVLSAQELAGISLAVGEAAKGIEGWRLTHRKAEAAQLVARRRPRGLTRYLDVALEATALQDEVLADALIERYLTPLDDGKGGGAGRRRMLRAFFDAEHNVSSAAAGLKVDRSTIHRQLKEIERRLDCRLHERQAEIEVALRLEKLRVDHRAGVRHTSA